MEPPDFVSPSVVGAEVAFEDVDCVGEGLFLVGEVLDCEFVYLCTQGANQQLVVEDAEGTHSGTFGLHATVEKLCLHLDLV
jgi:hypothetical protein